MKFIVDAQLPRSLAAFLRDKGFDVIHTCELPDGNETTDAEIIRLSLTAHFPVLSVATGFLTKCFFAVRFFETGIS